ncbi:MAG: hypothetical protein U0074_25935 [Kouleothrix sp.]
MKVSAYTITESGRQLLAERQARPDGPGHGPHPGFAASAPS